MPEQRITNKAGDLARESWIGVLCELNKAK